MRTFDDAMAAAHDVATLLIARNERVAVAESAAGGMISAALLAVPGASSWYLGGIVVYTGAARVLLAGDMPAPSGLRGATEEFARYEASTVAERLGATWGIGETGAAGPAGNPYGDPAGHAWVAVHGPVDATRRLATGSADRAANMAEFASAAISELVAALRRA